jgi:TPR repeat protein
MILGLAGCAAASGTELKTTFDAGVALYDKGDYAGAYKLWSSIDDEDIAAMRNVAMMLRKGQGVEKDPKAAEAMFARAAAAGLPTAQADLADMLLKGEAGPPNVAKALPLLEMAAAANHPIAQFELAELYVKGDHVPRDIATARRLYAAAASHGMKEAEGRLAALGPAEPVRAPSQTSALRPSVTQ